MTRVAVVGLGKIGMPLATRFASSGAEVIGCDINPDVVAAVNAGRSAFREPGLDAALLDATRSGRLHASTDTASAVAASDVVVVVVRVEIDESRRADLTQVRAAGGAIGAGLRRGSLVKHESTVPVGVTRGEFAAAIEATSGLKAGTDFHLAYSPERVSSGTLFRDLETYPKVVGGIDAASTGAAAGFYSDMLGVEIIRVPDMETAEFTKLAESAYRDVNIALANQLAIAAEAFGVDYATAVGAANSQPFSHLHAPGVGVGGHCIPVYPYFLLQQQPLSLLAEARNVNDGMAAHAASRLEAAVGGLRGRSILILGLAYRGGVAEAAFSSTLLLAAELRSRGASVLVHDPLFSDEAIAAYGLQPSPLPPELPIDAVLLQAMHEEYRTLDLGRLGGCSVFLDGRGAFDRGRVEAAGLRYIAIGRPWT